MLNSLTLQNFGKVEASNLVFSPGLTALRGANEAGKSTRYKAVLYALFGARALPMSLSETVTWGKPESSLRVSLTFTYDNKQYSIVRSKSGARLTSNGLEVNGQAEVTSYIEKLFEVDADAASRIMIASQNALRSSLDNKSTVSLIERLANLSLIDDLVTKCKAQLPNGDVAMILEQLKYVEDLKEPSDADMLDATKQESGAKLKVENLQNALLELRAKADPVKAAEAAKIIAEAERHSRELQIAMISKDNCESRLLQPTVVDNSQQLIYARNNVANQKNWRATIKAWRAYTEYKPYTGMRYASQEAYTELMRTEAAVAKQHTAEIAKLERLIAVKRGSLITQTVCGLCSKDLSAVPEVQEKNKEIIQEIGKLEQELPGHSEALAKAEANCLELLKHDLNAEHSKVLRLASEWVRVDHSTFPAIPVWVGDVMNSNYSEEPDYAAELARQEALHDEYLQDKAERLVIKNQLDKLNEQIAKYVEVDVQPYVAIVTAQAKLATDIAVAEAEARAAKVAAEAAEKHLESVTTNYVTAKQQYLKGLEQKQKLENLLVEYNKNNTLIKELRAARPQVAATLWQAVLAAISNYFSQIRGTQSIVTIEGNVFKVDGHDAEAQSGSTLDSLGLAIRIALGKTFLPNVDFLLLDEPASGMDADREAAMLATLAGVGYNQTIVITHSELCDTFADQVVVV